MTTDKAAAPVGEFVLVPRVPTYQMAEAIGVKWESGDGFPRRYAAMLAAAPVGAVPQGDLPQLLMARAKACGGDKLLADAANALASQAARMGELEADNERLRLAFDDEDEKASVHWYAEWVGEKRASEAAEADAARYRWLRHKLTCGNFSEGEQIVFVGAMSPEQLDCAIDKLRGEAG